MKLKSLSTVVACCLLPFSAHARLTGFDNATSLEKEAQGFEISNLEADMNDRYVSGADIKAEIGRDAGSFKLLLEGVVLLPVKGDSERKQPRVKLGAYGIALDADTSLTIYNELAVDYTPKKIAEGIASGDSVFKCEGPTKCQLLDERGSFWMFEGHRVEGQGNLFRAYRHGHFNYESFSFEGKVLTSQNKLTSAFKKALAKQVLEMAPNEIKYFQKSSSSATNQKSFEQHKREAKKEAQEDLGKTDKERMVMKSILKNLSTSYREGVKRGSRSGCTYFCGTSGRFVEATVTAKTKF